MNLTSADEFHPQTGQEQLAEIREQQRETNERMETLLSDIVQQAHETTADSDLGWQVRLLLDALGRYPIVLISN